MSYVDYRMTLFPAEKPAQDAQPNIPTNPAVLESIFTWIHPYPGELLVDIGAGNGNILNFWSKRFPFNRNLGVEINTRVRQESMVIADASTFKLPSYALYYMFNPFRGATMVRFEANLRKVPNVRLIYNGTHDLEIWSNWMITPIPGPFRAALLIK